MLFVSLKTYFMNSLFSGGLFLKAAELINDEKLLLQIRDQDMFAIEVCYHRTCYKDYIKVLDKTAPATFQSETVQNSIFRKFYLEVIEKQIIENGEVMRISKLEKLLNEMLSERNEPLVHINSLKLKLKRIYPRISSSCTNEHWLSCVLQRAVASDCSSVAIHR